jgi:hypothetical protein
MHLPDPSLLYVTLGTMAGNMIEGIPIWTMLIGQSGSGKTKMLKSLLKLPRVVAVGSMKGEASFLSGTSRREKAKDATGGVLNKLGDNGCIAYMDFTTLISKGENVVNEILGALRELFDETYQREVGTEGGRTIEHKGRVNLIAGCTPAIDRAAEVNGEMGQRTLYYRLPKTSGYQESSSALRSKNIKQDTEDMQDMVASMFYALDLTMEKVSVRREMNVTEVDRVVSLAMVGCTLRGTIPRHWKNREVDDVAAVEVASRYSQQLGQLFLGMEALGLDEPDCWEVLEKIILDGMPQIRRAALQAVIDGKANGGMRVSTAAVSRVVKVSESAASRTLEDLYILGVVERMTAVSGESGKKLESWKLTDWAEERFKKVGVEG